MKFLMDDKLAPITTEIGFLEASASMVTTAYLEWNRSLGRSFKHEFVSGSLEDVLRSLLPLVTLVNRHLFVPTKGDWIAYFDNGWRGTYSTSAIAYLADHIQCRGVIMNGVPDTIRTQDGISRGRYGSVKLSIYGPQKTEWLNPIRSIHVLHDGDRWVFDNLGTPFSFEDNERYKARRIRDRFTLDMLRDYLGRLGLFPFEEDFYLPEGKNMATLMENLHKSPKQKEYTLEEARARF